MHATRATGGGGLDRLDHFLSLIARIAAVAMLLLILVQVVARYILDLPIYGIVEFTETFLMPAIVFFSIGLVEINKGHVRVEILYDRLSGGAKRTADAFIHGCTFIFYALIAWLGAEEALLSLERGYTISSDLPLSLAFALAIVPIGAGAMSLRQIVGLYIDLRGRTGRGATT